MALPAALVLAVLMAVPSIGPSLAGPLGPSPGGPVGLSIGSARGSPAMDLGAPTRLSGGAFPGTPSHWVNASDGIARMGTLLGTGGAPPAVEGAASAMDPKTNETVVFGGVDQQFQVVNTTWVFEPSWLGPWTWVNVTNASSAPPAEGWSSMVFDENLGEFVLFGGENITGVASNETWTLNATNWSWSNRTAAYCKYTCPSARSVASMVFDPTAGGPSTLLFGGCYRNCSVPMNDTWGLIPSLGHLYWVPITSTALPSKRFGASLALDSVAGVLTPVLFGGEASSSPYFLNDTWEFVGARWQNVTASLVGPSPPPRAGAILAYDGEVNATLLSGGYNISQLAIVETWALQCDTQCSWSNETASWGAISESWAAAGSANGSPGVVVYGGLDKRANAPSNATFEFEASRGFFFGRVNVSFDGTVERGATAHLSASISVSAGNASRTADGFYFWSVVRPDSTRSSTATNASLLSVMLDSIGRWSVAVTAVDPWGVDQAFVWNITAVGPGVTVTCPPVVSETTVALDFRANASDLAYPPLSFEWSFGDGHTATTDEAQHSFQTPGTYDPQVLLTDALGNNATARCEVRILPHVAIDHVTADGAPTDVGLPISFAANGSGGQAPLSTAWEFGDGGPPSTGWAARRAFERAGTFTVTVVVTDALGFNASDALSISVAPSPTVTIAAMPTSALTGVTVTFSGAVSGGVGPYEYRWAFGDSEFGTGAVEQHAFRTAGAYRVTVWVNDSVGGSASQSLEFNVAPAPPSQAPPSPPGAWQLVAAIAGAAILGAVASIFALRNRRRALRPPAAR